MKTVELQKALTFKGQITPPPDKSISHRAVVLSSLAKGVSSVSNFLKAQDTISTLNAFRALGIEITESSGKLLIHGKGLHGLSAPEAPIECGNSGTTMRLLSGVIAGCGLRAELRGDESLSRRPMSRVVDPLASMGADIAALKDNKYPPIAIGGKNIIHPITSGNHPITPAVHPITYEMPIASAQVKSAVLLAGLYADGTTEVIELNKSRDHTERMLAAYGADITVDGQKVGIRGGSGGSGGGELTPLEFSIPGDFSSAAFIIAGALVVPGSDVMIKDVGLNPTRTGFLSAIKRMGANVEVLNQREVSGEMVGDIRSGNAGTLKAIEVTGEDVPALIDEFPILCVLAACADGETRISGAKELRVKESDRIATVAEGLRRMGIEVREFEDGLSIKGGRLAGGAKIDSHGDHRVAMAFSIAALAANGKTTISGAEAVAISFPAFFDTLKELSA